MLYDTINEVMKHDHELLSLLKENLTDDCYSDQSMKTMTVDLGYQLYKYSNYQNQSSIDKEEDIMNNSVDNNLLEECISLLKANKNLILTGAPGTGKTFTAKQIAIKMLGLRSVEELENSEQLGFVQFHPSYDYTDFIEGLRPVEKNGIIGFERKDGVFKEFCKRAVILNRKSSQDEDNKELKVQSDTFSSDYDSIYNSIISDIIKEGGKLELHISNKPPKKYICNNNQIRVVKPGYDTIPAKRDNILCLFNSLIDRNIRDISELNVQEYENILASNRGDKGTFDYSLWRPLLQERGNYLLMFI